MEIDVNGRVAEVPEAATVRVMLDTLGLAGRGGISVAVNNRIVRAGSWETHELFPQDRVVILTVAQGG